MAWLNSAALLGFVVCAAVLLHSNFVLVYQVAAQVRCHEGDCEANACQRTPIFAVTPAQAGRCRKQLRCAYIQQRMHSAYSARPFLLDIRPVR